MDLVRDSETEQDIFLGGISQPIGVIDIGSNSVRMVVYEGLLRSPQFLFNEKVLCGLGRAVGKTGQIDAEAYDRALDTLERYAHLAEDMDLHHIEAVATAAVREADNGKAFVEDVRRKTGIEVRVISGKQESYYSALGVLSGIPEAGGVIGDLGGGSLELAEVADGKVGRRVSLPIGPVRLLGEGIDSEKEITSRIKSVLKKVDWLGENDEQPFYLVGGSWRAVARIQMQLNRYPLPIIHQFAMSREDALTVCARLKESKPEDLKRFSGVASRRLPTLPHAAIILETVLARTGAKTAVVSSFGLREGLLYKRLQPEIRKQDPFLAACHDIASRQGRYAQHGEVIMAWLDPLFAPDESAEGRRLREAVCIMSDIGWRGHPDFRAERAMYESLYGWFVAIEAHGRAILGLALFMTFGGSTDDRMTSVARRLLEPEEFKRAVALGRAVRLAQRLSAGTADPLVHSRLLVEDGSIFLEIDEKFEPLLGEVVVRRLRSLASTMNLGSEVRVVKSLKRSTA